MFQEEKFKFKPIYNTYMRTQKPKGISDKIEKIGKKTDLSRCHMNIQSQSTWRMTSLIIFSPVLEFIPKKIHQ